MFTFCPEGGEGSLWPHTLQMFLGSASATCSEGVCDSMGSKKSLVRSFGPLLPVWTFSDCIESSLLVSNLCGEMIPLTPAIAETETSDKPFEH